MKLIIINGPNLNLLGSRETTVYGKQTFPAFLKKLRERYPEIHIEFYQTNIEGEIIDAIPNSGFIGKPINTRTFVTEICAYLKGPEGGCHEE